MRLSVPAVLLLLAPLLPARQPTGDHVLRTVRTLAAGQNQELRGFLQEANSDTRVPVGLFLMGEKIQFTFQSPKTGRWTPFEMRLRNDHWELLEMRNGKPAEVPAARLGERIAGSDVSYEDLAMHFLYWPRARLEGTEKTGGQDCWKVRVENPGRGGNYGLVHVWAEKKSGALMKVVGYNRADPARALKQFEVTEFGRGREGAVLRQIRVSSFHPRTGAVTGITHLQFPKAQAGAPGELP